MTTRYSCDSTGSEDILTVYTTNQERPNTEHLVLVAEGLEDFVSVLLTRDQAITLGNQIQDFIINGHK